MVVNGLNDLEVFLFLMSVDYTKKSQVLKLGICRKVKQLDKDNYERIANGDFDLPYYDMMFCLDNNVGIEDLEEARRINSANCKRVMRLNKRIKTYLSMGCCIWLTLTFNDGVLSKTSKETRKKYVTKYLKSQSCYYVGNIDYGKTTEREHYHALLVAEHIDMSQWSYGFAYTERIKNHVNCSIKISKYVSKLTNHAIKETTKRSCYIYSRM